MTQGHLLITLIWIRLTASAYPFTSPDPPPSCLIRHCQYQLAWSTICRLSLSFCYTWGWMASRNLHPLVYLMGSLWEILGFKWYVSYPFFSPPKCNGFLANLCYTKWHRCLLYQKASHSTSTSTSTYPSPPRPRILLDPFCRPTFSLSR